VPNTTSTSPVVTFRDRHHAGVALAAALAEYAAQEPLILAVGRGGIPVAAVVAEQLGAELDVMIVQKLGVPGHVHISAGAVSSRGSSRVNHQALSGFGISAAALDKALDNERLVLEQQEREIRGNHAPISVAGRLVIAVDDVVITGTTLHTAIAALRAAGARQVVLAVPVGVEGELARLSREVDALTCLAPRVQLDSLSQAYEHAAPVSVGYAQEAYACWEAKRSPTSRRTQRAARSEVPIPAGNQKLAGTLTAPEQARGVVAFLHGSGSNRFSPRNRYVAEALERAGFATLLFDLLTAEEQATDAETHELGTNVELLGSRATAMLDWVSKEPALQGLKLALFGASTGAAAALLAVAERPGHVRCVIARGGRPDLAEAALERITTPVLLLVGSEDHAVLELNREAARRLGGPHWVTIVPGATHLFAEPGALQAASDLALGFLDEWLPAVSARQ
jgi:putative phosphoribosyl transferase